MLIKTSSLSLSLSLSSLNSIYLHADESTSKLPAPEMRLKHGGDMA
ncbi:hypothetical protein AALP_AA1G077700 [Arabis alpina]|uniref:Uncharacterized protein n=1 Tax=Arabis alpina TaxID=50452 RepID=A0A087HLT6_ARAAL|nr:hypothetical protein AALP_AA1G077700 [Arabis alpina]